MNDVDSMTVLRWASLLQGFNTRKSFPLLSRVTSNAPSELLEKFRLPGLAIALYSADLTVVGKWKYRQRVAFWTVRTVFPGDSLGRGGSVLTMRTPRQEVASASTGPVVGQERCWGLKEAHIRDGGLV